jgi:hypothetical protein
MSDITALSGPRQDIALAGLRASRQTEQVAASVVGDALENAKEVSATVPKAPGRGENVNTVA